jgi:hypothetical protein
MGNMSNTCKKICESGSDSIFLTESPPFYVNRCNDLIDVKILIIYNKYRVKEIISVLCTSYIDKRDESLEYGTVNNHDYTSDFYFYIKFEMILNKIDHLVENILIKLRDRSYLLNEKFKIKNFEKQSINKEHSSNSTEMYTEVYSDEEQINKYYKDFDYDEIRGNMEIEYNYEGIKQLKNKLKMIDGKNSEFDEGFYMNKLIPFLIDIFKAEEIKDEQKLNYMENQMEKLLLPN